MTGRRHFEAGGAAYAASRPTYPPELARLLAGICAARGHALDVGCGTGQFSVLLADHFARVTAVDPSRTQIDNASPRPNIHYTTGAAERFDLADDSVDLVVAAQAAHWFDLDLFYPETRRVARPGAILALITYGVPEFDGGIQAAFDQFYWHEIHDFWPPDRRHVEEGYASLPFPFSRGDLPPVAILRDWDFADFTAYVGTWSATVRAEKAGEGARITEALARLEPHWGAARRQVRWPITVLAGVVDQRPSLA